MNKCIYWIKAYAIFSKSHCEIDRKDCSEDQAIEFACCKTYQKHERRMADLADDKEG